MSTRRSLSESDSANADLHIIAALDILNERAPGYLTDKLITVSDYLWQQRRFDCAADDALARVRVIQRARCAS
jgi:hypothetical protein